MIETLWFYSDLGFWHVIDWNGLDHFYFIVALVLPFSFKESGKLLWWVTLFTIGHTLSLIGNFYTEFSFSSYWIEILIPITIALSAVAVFFLKSEKSVYGSKKIFPLMTIFFGIIHGLGFGRYFKMLIFDDAVTISLFSFALGIELAQVTIVVFVLFTSWLVLKIFKNSKRSWELFMVGLILLASFKMILERI
ncbi:MAG: HupE/UreJ family protein [Flavobacteriaceae bacterium]|nr:HupE/UreJ family protein [Flavobacteriaceae bacterium]